MKKAISNPAHRRMCARLRGYRESAALSQAALAAALGKPQSFVSSYEAGNRRLDLVELDQICDALGIDLLDLVQEFKRG